MRNVSRFSTLAIGVLLVAGPALAQSGGAASATSTPAAGVATTAPATHGPAAHTDAMSPRTATTTPSERNPVLADSGEARASRIIGSAVYNDRNEKIGTIDDLVIGRGNQPMTAVLSVGGFLGMGKKLVAVPYSSLTFGDTNAGADNRVVMQGASKDTLKSMADYHYVVTHRA